MKAKLFALANIGWLLSEDSVKLGYITCNKKQLTLFICKFFLMLIQKNPVVYHYQ